ncbi:DUF4097 family beta strand repeat-containing protein [Amycolatopsis sp. NPDC004378]
MTAYTTPRPITATLTTAGARVRVAASDRRDTVVRVEPVDRASKSDVKVAERTEVAFADGELSIKTAKPGAKHGSVAITVELPAGSRLVLDTAWTDVRTGGPLGDCELNSASGTVRLEHVAALRGQVASGEITVERVTGPAAIDAGTAAVRIGHAHADVGFTGSSGRLEIDRADGGVVAKAADCPIRIGRLTRGHADLANASGGIEVGVAEGTTVRVDADSTKGSVRTSLPVHDGTAELKILARTRRDDIVVRRAAG